MRMCVCGGGGGGGVQYCRAVIQHTYLYGLIRNSRLQQDEYMYNTANDD